MSTSICKKGGESLACSALRRAAHGARGILINNHAQNAQQIRTQVEALAPFFEFIGYDDLKKRLHGHSGKKPFCLMTFDDGTAINASETAPELLRLGVPAVFYLVTGAMDGHTPFWFDRFAALSRIQGKGALPGLDAWKAMPWRMRDRELGQLCAAAGVDADLTNPATRGMSWVEAVRLQNEGFELGSHTVDHAILPVETEDEAARQITESVRQMKQQGLRCRTFAFPNGNASPSWVEIALDSGMESTMSTVPVWLRKKDMLTYLPRLYLKNHADTFYIHTKTLVSRIGFVLKNPNGEGRKYLLRS